MTKDQKWNPLFKNLSLLMYANVVVTLSFDFNRVILLLVSRNLRKYLLYQIGYSVRDFVMTKK